MGSLLGWMAAAGVLITVTIGLAVTVTVFDPPAPPVPTAEEIGREVVTQYSAQIEERRLIAQERKKRMWCGLPGYEACR